MPPAWRPTLLAADTRSLFSPPHKSKSQLSLSLSLDGVSRQLFPELPTSPERNSNNTLIRATKAKQTSRLYSRIFRNMEPIDRFRCSGKDSIRLPPANPRTLRTDHHHGARGSRAKAFGAGGLPRQR